MHRRKAIGALSVLMVVVGIIFYLSIAFFRRSVPILEIGMGADTINLTTAVFCVLMEMKILWELIRT